MKDPSPFLLRFLEDGVMHRRLLLCLLPHRKRHLPVFDVIDEQPNEIRAELGELGLQRHGHHSVGIFDLRLGRGDVDRAPGSPHDDHVGRIRNQIAKRVTTDLFGVGPNGTQQRRLDLDRHLPSRTIDLVADDDGGNPVTGVLFKRAI